MIYGYFGVIGSGKTLGLVIHAYKEFLKGKKIFSTMPLNFKHKPVRNIKDFLRCKRGFLIGDELWFLLDSRYSRSDKNNVLSMILLRSRKQMLNIGYTEQVFTQIDLRIRENTQFFITSTVDPYFENLEEAKEYADKGGQFNLEQEIMLPSGHRLDTRYIEHVERFFKLYDTDADPYIVVEDDVEAKVEKYMKKESKSVST